MRNKILVLVLALVCLFAVSALAAGESITAKFNNYVDLKAEIDALAAEEGHEYYTTGGAYNWFSGDKYRVDSYQLPKCDEAGYINLICIADHTGDETTCKGKLGDWDGDVAGSIVSISVDQLGHQKGALGDHVDATCKANGWAYYYCATCATEIKWQGDSTKANYDPALDKANVEHVKDDQSTPKTCTEYAHKLVVCKVCSKVLKDETLYAEGKAAHVYVKADGTRNAVTETITYATCEQEGKTKTTELCVNCHQVNPDKAVKYDIQPKLSHTENAFANFYEVTDETNKNGLKYAITKNMDPFKAKVATVDGTYYTLTDGSRLFKVGTLTFKYEPMTCEKDGLITISCNVCDCKECNVQYAVESLGHDPRHSSQMPEMEDCTKSYTVAYTCANCGGFFTEIIGAQKYHEYNEEPNSIIQYWNNGATKVEIYREFHDWDNAYWVDDPESDNPEDGHYEPVIYYNIAFIDGVEVGQNVEPKACLPYTEVYQCYHNIFGDYWCQTTKTVEVKATEKVHCTFEEVGKDNCYAYTAPTCNSTGSATFACIACGDTVTETLDALKHEAKNPKWTVAVQPSCAAPGKATNVCKHCNIGMEETLPQLKHELVYNEKLSTPVNGCVAGVKVYKCANCGETKTEDVAAPHNDSGLTMEEYTAYVTPTCTTAGSKTFKCKTCKQVVTVPVEKLNHNFETLTDELFAARFVEATCCSPAYYTIECTTCPATNKAIKYVPMGKPTGHKDLTAQQLADIRDVVFSNNFGGEYTQDRLIVKGAIDCESAATGSYLCKKTYDVWTQKADGYWKLETKPGVCTYEWTFTLPVREHVWTEAQLDKETGKYYVECEICEATKETVMVKPEYVISMDDAKGKVVLKDKNMNGLVNAWVRISYGFELSNGDNIAIITCMPIDFDVDENGVQYGTFSFFALNTAMKSTGVQYMVVDQYDAMSKPLGDLIGHTYGMLVE